MKKVLLIGLLFLTASCHLPATSTESAPVEAPALATAAPTPTAAPTSTPSPVPPPPSPTPVPLFFTEDFNGVPDAWTFFQTGGARPAQVSLENDALIFSMDSPHVWQYAILDAHEYESVFVSMKASAAPSGSLGLVCGYSEENGWLEFNVSHEGAYSLLHGKWLAEGIAEYRPILLETNEYLQAGNLNYELGFTCRDNAVFMHINGKMFRTLDVSHIGLFPGKVGVSAASFGDVPARAAVEWFKVSPPEW